MQGGGRGRGNGDPFFGFGDAFAGFGGGMPSLFGSRDPFDDPFFTQPFGGMLQQPNPFGHAGVSPFGSNLFGPNGSPFGSSLFGPNGSPFMDSHGTSMDSHARRVHEHRQVLPNSSTGPVIEELNSDDEKDEPEAGNGRNNHPNQHGRYARQPYVEHPYERTEGRELAQTQYGNQLNIMHDTHSRPQAQSFTFQSSSVTYGGSNGAYYTSSTTRRAGSDGLRFEEHKEADSVTGQAAHRISRGIHDKGHTLSRHLKSDGHVDSMQTLHNLNEDELTGFEEAWKGKARHLPPGWGGAANAHHVSIEGSGEGSRGGGGGGALPSTENVHAAGGRRKLGASEHAQSSKVRRR